MTRAAAPARAALAVTLALVVAAGCGGGSGSAASSDQATDTTATTEVPTTTEPSTTTTDAPPTTEAPAPPAPPAPPTTRSLPAATGPLTHVAGRTIALDAGHNGGNAAHSAEINAQVDAGNGVMKACDTAGTAGDDGYAEFQFTLSVAQAVRDELVASGAHVVMVRDDSAGWGPCITQRAAVGNAAHADAALSIHADGNLAAGARGFHVILPAVAAGGSGVVAASASLGHDIRDQVATTGMPASNYIGSGGLITRGDLGGLNLSTVPKVFIECGNMRQATDLAMLEDPAWRARLAHAIAAGFDTYLAG